MKHLESKIFVTGTSDIVGRCLAMQVFSHVDLARLFDREATLPIQHPLKQTCLLVTKPYKSTQTHKNGTYTYELVKRFSTALSCHAPQWINSGEWILLLQLNLVPSLLLAIYHLTIPNAVYRNTGRWPSKWTKRLIITTAYSAITPRNLIIFTYMLTYI